jgi:Lrp/AsnC family transcriptional regulator, regulator for asnA, asnC and gidA
MLDELDKKLVELLQKSGRLSNIALARMLFVSERTIRNRMKILLEHGTIKITAVPDLDALGYAFTGIVGLQVELGKIKNIASELARHPNVCYIVNVTGQFDFILIIIARSSKEFADIMENFISQIPGILRTETHVGLNTYKGNHGNMDTVQLINNLEIPSS